MTLEERCLFWQKWEERTRQLWCDLEDDKVLYFEGSWDGNGRLTPYDIEQSFMEQLFNTAVKMHILVSERLELAEKTYSAVKDKEDELRKTFNLDEDDYPDSMIDYKTLQEAI